MRCPYVRHAIIRGIRYHLAFANLPQVLQLYNHDSVRFDHIKRARSARLIRSNIIRRMDDEFHFPYCIWHPDVASEETYRKLAQRYAELKYHVGRACTVAVAQSYILS